MSPRLLHHDEPDPEEARVAAAISAEQAAEAVAAADEADLAAARAGADGRVCLHCHTAMVKHDNPASVAKFGCWHCDGCGCCFDGNKVRAGHEPCAAASGG